MLLFCCFVESAVEDNMQHLTYSQHCYICYISFLVGRSFCYNCVFSYLILLTHKLLR